MIAAARFAGGMAVERPTLPPRRRPKAPKRGPGDESAVVLRGILALMRAGFRDDEICLIRKIKPRALQLAKARLRLLKRRGDGGPA